jgi:membrane-associated phospholipid phosphatase
MRPLPRLPAKIRLCAMVACIAVAVPAGASGLDAGTTDKIALDVPRDATLTAVAALGAIIPNFFTDQLAPESCRWCGVNPIDNWFHNQVTASPSSRSTANKLSSFIAYGAMPAIALGGAWFATGPHETDGAGLRAVAIVAESVAVTGALTQAIKFSVGRQRPHAHYQSTSTTDPQANLSFPSGHASITAAAGTSAAMVATLEESPAASWLWGTAGLLTFTAGFLRMVAEEHYFTDTVAGAALGAGTGVLLPLLHRRGSFFGGNAVPSVAAREGGASFSLAGRF